ncbi:MAG: homocysteine S-methyltransferase family protein [Oscillospiraceae bacterium]|nr:homocysteine S-methyltransferase family protein [Oscillospiraceae bacterium]
MELTFPLILDGATGTQLQKRGFTGSECAEKWTLDHPEAIIDIQKEYVSAGSRVLYSPTFGANRTKLEAHGIFNRVSEYNRKLVSLSREASGGKALVAGDISPTGLFLYPLGETDFEELVDIYTEQAAALEEAGVDLFVIETMMTVPEARAAVLAVKSVSEKPVFVTFTCNENGRTLTGSDVAAVLQIMQGMGVDAFGLNCSTGPKEMAEQLKRLHKIARVPLIAKPNAGSPVIEGGETIYDCPPEAFTGYLEEMAAAGVKIFGGCCGTAEEHIRALAEKTACLHMEDPSPEMAALLPCATEKELFFLPADITGDLVINAGAGLEDAFEEAAENGKKLITVEFTGFDQLDDFASAQYMIACPLCIRCADPELLEQALRLYQGRALYEGPLSEEQLQPLAVKYGLIF